MPSMDFTIFTRRSSLQSSMKIQKGTDPIFESAGSLPLHLNQLPLVMPDFYEMALQGGSAYRYFQIH